MSGDIARPWALVRRHAGWAEILLIQSETPDTATGVRPGREDEEPVTFNAYAVLARFDTAEAARAARERGLIERRKHDAAVDAAEAALKAAEKVREAAWIAGLRADV
jgi:hypothetical protein